AFRHFCRFPVRVPAPFRRHRNAIKNSLSRQRAVTDGDVSLRLHKRARLRQPASTCPRARLLPREFHPTHFLLTTSWSQSHEKEFACFVGSVRDPGGLWRRW